MQFAPNPELRSSYNFALAAAGFTAGAVLLGVGGCASNAEQPVGRPDISSAPAPLAPLELGVEATVGDAVQLPTVAPKPKLTDKCINSPETPAKHSTTYPLGALITLECIDGNKGKQVPLFTQPRLGSPKAGQVTESTEVETVCTVIGQPVTDKANNTSNVWNVINAMPGKKLPFESAARDIATVPAVYLGYAADQQLPCQPEQSKWLTIGRKS